MFGNLNRFGPSMPACNNRQFSTIGTVKSHPEDMKLKPEYLGNNHFKFLNNFGLSNSFLTDKKFIDINNTVNRQHIGSQTGPNSGYIMRNIASTITTGVEAPRNTYYDRTIYNVDNDKSKVINFSQNLPNTIITDGNKIEEAAKTDGILNKHNKIIACENVHTKMPEESKNSNNLKLPKKMKGNKAYMQTDKTNQKCSSKKSKKQKNFQKQSKRESDRNVCNSLSHNKRKNKLWHKKSLEMEIMEVDDTYDCSYSNHNLESPVITQVCSVNLPTDKTASIKNNINTVTSPITPTNGIKIENNKVSPTIQIINENENYIEIDNSPKQNNFRSRLPSECESEDSFIVFDDNSKCFDMELSDCDEDSADFEFVSEEDSSEDDDDVVDFCSTPQNAEKYMFRASLPIKKVRFAVGKELCEVHPMIQWSFAYQKARKGPWEQYAVDRMRFKNRVRDAEPTLNVILQPALRNRIYEERFIHSEN